MNLRVVRLPFEQPGSAIITAAVTPARRRGGREAEGGGLLNRYRAFKALSRVRIPPSPPVSSPSFEAVIPSAARDLSRSRALVPLFTQWKTSIQAANFLRELRSPSKISSASRHPWPPRSKACALRWR